MTEYYVTRLPLIGQLAGLTLWLFVLLVVMFGLVLLFALRVHRLRTRVNELEIQLELMQRRATVRDASSDLSTEAQPRSEGVQP